MQLRCVDDESIVKSLPGIAPIAPLADLGFNSPVGIVLWTIGLGTSVRLLCAATAIDLSYGEAYYVATARHFALSYFDHPPLSFWIAAAIMKLTGSDALFVLRVPFILIFDCDYLANVPGRRLTLRRTGRRIISTAAQYLPSIRHQHRGMG